ncbi:glycosyltransferase [Marinicaulis aureus]|uniref:Glycosyltransferase n=1 Tax=Hyphococcus aureus TaxID=2666033 RepID=A0ABW1KX68_9PROT
MQRETQDSLTTVSARQWVGAHQRYPDTTGKRRAEGGARMNAGAARKQETSSPRVSIVTVVYNRAETIERSIKSVLDQRYQNIEYIIIDGGSSDGTIDVIQKYRERIDYFISEPDNGVYSAMNKGISLAAGDYICLLNADDYYDENFVSSLIECAARTDNPDIVCGAIRMNDALISPGEMSDGVYFGHLNFFHGTFLVKKECYDEVGPYNEDYRIVSDVLWVQNAYAAGMSFAKCKDAIVHFSDGGLSSGNTPERRELLISETAKMYRARFPFLTDEDARAIYLYRFHKKHSFIVEKIVDRYSSCSEKFNAALALYVKYCLCERPAFVFETADVDPFLPVSFRLASRLGVDLPSLRFALPDMDVSALIHTIDDVIERALQARAGGKKVILHFAEKFSSPSETFIYDLLMRMQGAGWAHNVMLCDERRLEKERPYPDCLELPWPKLPPALREILYVRFFEKLGPDALICHFAASGRWLYARMTPLGLHAPTIHMTHGIDVFAISTNPEYKEFIQKHAVLDPQTEFTAVSEYLATELVARGVPPEKITLSPNVVHPRFFEHRKTEDFYDGERELRLLNVGRLIPLKGHRYLLEGLRYFIDHVSKNVRLTILYGGDDRDLEGLNRLVGELGLSGHVDLIDYVNFRERPDFFSNFDLFVMASTYSDDHWKRSESFGIATLEAIAGGLPVIVTDAGGSAEVVGREHKFAKIVPHANGRAIGEAIEAFYRERDGFSDNLDYAQERLAAFASQKQLSTLRGLIEKVSAKPLNVALFSAIASGGAGGAAMRVHESLLRAGVRSNFLTRYGQAVDRQTPFVNAVRADLKGEWDLLQSGANQHDGNTIFTVNEPRLEQATIARLVKDADVINIQWVARMLSVENIAYLSNLGKPLVITIRDMQPLAGGCHFFHGCEHWRQDCFACPQLVGDDRQIPYHTQRFKLDNWNRNNITVVTLSEHTARLVRQSPLFEGCEIERIANPIDLDTFVPMPQEHARQSLGLPESGKIAFYIPSFNSKVKGRAELREALALLHQKHPDLDLHIVTAGAAGAEEGEFPFKTTNLGRIDDKLMLAKAYAAADITLIPSLEETFSNTAAESVACGTPIAGFETGAIGEIAGGGERGATAPVGDCPGLAAAIYSVLTGAATNTDCRDYALERFSFEGQGQRYRDLFHKLASRAASAKAEAVPEALAPPLFSEQSGQYLFERQAIVFDAKKRAAIKAEQDQTAGQIANLQSRLSRLKAMTAHASAQGEPAPAAPPRFAAPLLRLASSLAKRSRLASLPVKLLLQATQIAAARPFMTALYCLLFVAGVAAIFVLAPAPDAWKLVLGWSGFMVACGGAYIVASFVKNRILALNLRVHQENQFRQRLLSELKAYK